MQLTFIDQKMMRTTGRSTRELQKLFRFRELDSATFEHKSGNIKRRHSLINSCFYGNMMLLNFAPDPWQVHAERFAFLPLLFSSFFFFCQGEPQIINSVHQFKSSLSLFPQARPVSHGNSTSSSTKASPPKSQL